ncbi:general substrate transporter [Amylocystis lapponica]|nr:general substrate transporter [Amylocystis lapponica]
MVLPEYTIDEFIHRGYWWRSPRIRMLNLCLILPLLTAAMNGFDSSLVNGLQILPAWQSYFKHPDGRRLGIMSAAQVIGSIAGLPLSPFASDILGRRPTLLIGSVLMSAGVALQSASTSFGMFVGARGLLGFGLAFALNAAPLLIVELAYPTQRGKFTAMYNASWYIGSILSAWMCFGALESSASSLWSWRAPSLMQAVVPILQVALAWLIPESPRFLVSRGRESEAAAVLARFHAKNGDEHDPLVLFEMAQIRHALKLEREAAKRASFTSLLATPGNRRRMFIIVALAIFSQWSGNGLVSYYINLVLEGVGITNAGTKAAINGSLQVWNLCAAMIGAFLVDRLGRRTLFIISNIGMLVDFGVWTLANALFETTDNKAAARATIPFIFLFYFFYDLAYTPMLIAYTLEILPFNIRAKGFAVMNFIVSLTLAFNQFVNPWALDAIGWRYYLVYCGWLILELIFIVTFIVETRGRTLEETATLFDGEQCEQVLVQTGGQAAALSLRRRTAHFSWRAMFEKGATHPGAGAEAGPGSIEMYAAGKARLDPDERGYMYCRDDDNTSV